MKTKYNIGQEVYLISKRKMKITINHITINEHGYISYSSACGHYEMSEDLLMPTFLEVLEKMSDDILTDYNEIKGLIEKEKKENENE